jgi:protease-4
MLVGFLTPVCTCIAIFIVMWIGIVATVDSFETEEETGPGIGIIELQGPITEGETVTNASKGYLIEQIEWMEEEDDVKAIVVRANSPGGGANASDEIWYRLSQVEKPVIISMQGLCASGCLYIASAGDKIYASRNTLVGSIGVISTFFNVEELFNDIGIEVEVIVTGESKDFGSLFREMTPEERAFWQQQITYTFDNFIQVVANRPGSTLSEAQVRELATGQVWAAPLAKDYGLVDEIGYEEDAIEYAVQQANLGDNYRIIEYPLEFDFSRLFSPQLSAEGYFDLPDSNEILEAIQQPPIQYRYYGPYDNTTTNSPADYQISIP